jgi:glycosyltransferase involved in cell wall biosynthesis
LEILAKRADVDFVWVGHWDAKMHNDIETKLFDSPCKDRIHFVGYEPETALYHAGSDVYALTSREDPFPSVVLESFDAGVPVVAFSSTGGAASLVEDIGGIAVPTLNVAAFSAAICRLLDSPELSAGLGKTAQEYVDRHFSFRAYLSDLCGMLGVNLPTGE